MNTGAPHLPALLQLMTPEPNSPPMMNPAFFKPGITTTHSALLQICSGIPPSGAPRISERTAVDSFNRLASFFDGAASAEAPTRRADVATTTRFMTGIG